MAYNITLEGKNTIIAERMLEKIAKVFHSCEIEYWIEGGTLLGIRRENRLLPWDNDIDFSVKSTQIDKLNDFISVLKKSGYRVKTRHFSEDNDFFKSGNLRMIKIREKRFWGLLKGKVCADIFIKYPFQNNHYWEIANKTKNVPSEFYKEFSTISFKGFQYNIPNLTDEYLTYRYSNWQTPVKDWNTATDDKALLR